MNKVRGADVRWKAWELEGTARLELISNERSSHVSLKRLDGHKPPAGVLVRIIDAALDGPSWRRLYQGDPEGCVRYTMHYDGRITVKYRGVRQVLKVNCVGAVEDFSIPIHALAAMLGPAGLGIVDHAGQTRWDGEVSVIN